MAYTEDYYEEVDNILNKMKSNPFEDQDLNAVRYEDQGQIQPVGWVQNADGTNGEATVTVDADGITIRDGKISILDSGGHSVLSSGGFAGAWTDFIETGIYNSHFQYGTLNDTSVSEVGGGEGSANYEASLSSDIPYWVVASKASDVTLKRITDTNAIGGNALYVTATANGQMEMYQDIPISSGQFWNVLFYWKYYATATNSFNLSIHTFWMDEDHTTISSALGSGLNYETAQSTYYSESVESLDSAVPSNARYLRLVVLFTFGRGDSAAAAASATINGIRLAERVNYGKQQFPDGVTSIDADSIATDTFTATYLQVNIDANQNDWNPAGFSTSTSVGVTGLTAARTITGLIARATGTTVYLLNTSGQSLILSHESASSSANNRFSNPGAADLAIRTSGGVVLVYVANRWRVASP